MIIRNLLYADEIRDDNNDNKNLLYEGQEIKIKTRKNKDRNNFTQL